MQSFSFLGILDVRTFFLMLRDHPSCASGHLVTSNTSDAGELIQHLKIEIKLLLLRPNIFSPSHEILEAILESDFLLSPF